MKLVIVESPAKSKTIGKYLGNEYTVKASVGHVRDLPKSNKHAIDIDAGFVPNYEIARGKEKVVSELKPLVAQADEIILATDPDREGEAIAWHLMEALNLPTSKTKRVTFHEITKDAVEEAMTHPRVIDTNLRKAQEARRVLDRLVGYDLSGLIWKKVRYGLSAGRVQSPALRILMEREREIRAFVPVPFWVITADTQTARKESLPLTCTHEPTTNDEADRIVTEGRRGSWIVAEVKEHEQKRSPKPPFTTSTLQQAASTRLSYSPARTMALAQKLYEAGHITYMRTDSTTLSGAAIASATGVIKKQFGEDHVSVRTFKTRSKNAQEAHEAIRPTNLTKEVAGTTEEQKRLYRLIRGRTLASQMIDAKVLKTKVLVRVAEGAVPDFAVNGSRVIAPGWLLADPAARGEDTELPKLAPGDSLTLRDIAAEGKETQPPNRYSEAGLVKELEKRGIGRPSTYASIIKTLQDRDYVTKEGRTLIPTDTGDVVSSFLEKNFMEYIDDSFTAEMEDELDEIATGERDYAATLTSFYTDFSTDVKAKETIDKITNLGEAPPEFTCPTCGSGMIYKLGRGGTFMSCDRFPECNGARTKQGAEIEPDKPLGQDPETGLPVFVLDGRYGPYVQLGEKSDKNKKPKRASIPQGMTMDDVTLPDALKFLSLPRTLGTHPETGNEIVAGVGRFGPFIVHDGDFRSLKADDVYSIELPRALEILAEPKKQRGFAKKVAKKATKKTPRKSTRKTATKKTTKRSSQRSATSAPEPL
ncbi:type I DNA topoisomerase [Patescibacteria group bacterium]|jgi:DNA topoisomerase-1|nr:type I DNA topoisomerase [Patescibacteria group bacterium]